jgi:hypothetical protein
MSRRRENPKNETNVSATKKGDDYELVLQKIFKSMLAQDAANAVVERKKKLETTDGGTVEVDLYWEFKLAGVTHKVIVQAKDERNKIKQNELFAFHDVLENIPGQPRGVFVTRTGFQKGALKYAYSRGIGVATIRAPSDYTEKELKQFGIPQGTLQIQMARFFCSFSPDSDWTSRNTLDDVTEERLNKQIIEDYPDVLKMDLFNEKMQRISMLPELDPTFYQMDQSLPAGRHRAAKTYEFKNPTFVKTKNPAFPAVKVNHVTVLRETNMRDPFQMRADKLVKAILNDLTEGNVTLFNNEFKSDSPISFVTPVFDTHEWRWLDE